MKGFKDKKKKFHPINDKKGVRKRRIDQKPLDYRDPELVKHAGIPITDTMLKTGRRFARDNNAEILRNRLRTFNRKPPINLEYGDAGGKSKGLKLEGTHSFIAGPMTRSEAITCLEFCESFMNMLSDGRKKFDTVQLKPILETQLDDIFDDVTGTNDSEAEINLSLMMNSMRDNIKYILNRDGKWMKGYSVGVNEIVVRKDTPQEGGSYHYDFQLFKGSEHLPLSGTVYGNISAGNVVDMTLELYNKRSW